MNIEATRNPAYLTRLSCMAASLSQDPNALSLATTDCFSSGAFTRASLDAEQKQMIRDLELVTRQACPQHNATLDNVKAVLVQYAQITGTMAAQLMMSPTAALPFTAAMADKT